MVRKIAFLVLPEFSHLTRSCARVFTDAYVRRLAELTPRIVLRDAAPPALDAEDCNAERDPPHDAMAAD